MKKTIEVYALVVCFFALIWFAATFGLFLNQIVRITFPQLTTPINNYSNSVNQAALTSCPGAKENAVQGKANEQMQALWDANYKLSVQQERRDALRNIIHDIISLLISALIFVPHWKLARK